MRRGRKALKPAEQVGKNLGHLTHESAAEEARLKHMTRELTADQIAFSEMRGVLSGLAFVEKTVTVARIKLFLQWRESKKYKGLTYFDASGKSVTCQTFEDFCLALGISYETANRYIQNFKTLGEEFMESAQRMGVGITTLRQLSKLPEDEREAAKLLMDTEGKEALVGFVADLCSKHEKEKRAMQKEITGLNGDLDAQRNVTAKKNQKLDEMEALLHHRQADLPAQIQELQIDCAAASHAAINGVQKFTQIRLATMDLLKGNDQEAVLGAIGVTHLTTLWQVQAWLTEEMQLAEQIFGGSRIQVRAEDERGPDLTEEDITNLKNAGADEAVRVAGGRVLEVLAKKES